MFVLYRVPQFPKQPQYYVIKLKASAHSLKRFTSRLPKLSVSLSACITSNECHA